MKKLKTTNSPSVILKLKNIKPNSKITLFNIAHCIKLKWTLSQGLLAEMGGTSERTINRCLAELEEQGYIKRETKLFNGKGKETKYTIIWDNVTRYAKDYEWYEDNKTIENNQPIEVVNIESSNTEQAENEFISDEKKYGSRVMDFIDENGPEVMNIIRIKVECKLNPSEEIYRLSGNADVKLNDMIMSFGLTDDEKPNLLKLLNDYKNEEINKRLKAA